MVAGYFLASRIQDSECFRRHSVYSPAISSIDTSYHNVLFNGTISQHSPYRGEPHPSIDAAWHDLMNFNLTYITGDELAQIPGHLDSIRMPPEAGISDSYVGSLEVFHQLHCVNMLRKTNIWNYEYYNSTGHFPDPLDLQKEHFGHCIDMLRQVLMCNADVGIVTFRYVEDNPRPYPNFNNWHSCRNWDSIMEFADSRRVGKDWDRNYLHRQEDEKVWSVPP
ncbi:hypothetical protein CKM354_001282800 [Cercospora kikuchii]|uniref:Tat pathway signal sequence n=1 Tax=Cercospora kikuchii TaxID=84275 RepID=A0A9P3FMP7_9PEZI|nr:uncharacterized protein CKM354_001282800 [Cercospora kikuchii]GIZ49803.1 hypothetical protein CKM354_001282800 [Cercospora kikuchii]